MNKKDTAFLEGLCLGFFLACLWLLFQNYQKKAPTPKTSSLASIKRDSLSIKDSLLNQKGKRATQKEIERLNEKLKEDFKKLRTKAILKTPKLHTTSYEDTPLFHKPPDHLELGDIYPITKYNTPNNLTIEDEIQEKLDRQRFKKDLDKRQEKAFVEAFIQKAKKLGYIVIVNKNLEIVRIQKNVPRTFNSTKNKNKK